MTQLLSSREFYENAAEDYQVLSNDRDFQAQIAYIERFCQRKGKALELFAGPAYHGRILRKHGWDVHCIDASLPMKTAACVSGASEDDKYTVGLLPDVLSRHSGATFDLVLALRYSMGYLSPQEVEILFRLLRTMLSRGATVFVELHDLKLLAKGFRDLAIRERTVSLVNGQRLRCIWPHGDLRWCDSNRQVEMTIRLEHIDRDNTRITEYISREWIYSVAAIGNLAQQARFSNRVLTQDVQSIFPGCELLMLEAV